MNTITVNDGTAASTTPQLIDGYTSARAGRTIVHDTLDGDIAVSLIPPRPRSGTLQLLYASETAANECLTLHARSASFTLVSTERATVGMTYVVTDERIVLDDETRNVWTVEITYQEILP